jgi:phosphoribosylamine-glycine ligase
MKIGFVDDDGMLSIQGRWLDEGHEVHLWMPGVAVDLAPTPEIGKDRFLWPYTRNAEALQRLHLHTSFESLIDADLDLYVVTPGFQFGYETLAAEKRQVIGYSSSAYALEDMRAFGKTSIESVVGLDIQIPSVRLFYEAAALQEHLLTRKTACVIKQISNSPATARNRTIVARVPSQAASMLSKPNAWWDLESGLGGALVEDYVEGQEVCWGAFFNGERFVGPLYSCIEHKGAQDGDRGAVLTGEVGTPIYFHYGLTERNSRIWKIFRSMEPLFRRQCVGLIDINTVFNYETGELTFLEFTTRFGVPTGEVMQAMMLPEFDFGKALYTLTQGGEHCFDDAYRWDHGVGVAVYSYGYPLLDELLGGKENTYEVRGRGLSHEILFDFPEPPRGVSAKSLQIFCGWDPKERKFFTQYNDRQFITVGFGDLPMDAQASAYRTLKDYWLLGHTWRNDVGNGLAGLYKQGVKHGLFPSSSLTPQLRGVFQL